MKLPCDECGGKCCTFPTFTRKEFDLVKAKYGLPLMAQTFEFENAVVMKDTCPYLVKGKCSIYVDRPRNCKEYGVNPRMPCMFLFPVQAALQVHQSFEKLGERVQCY
jgi:Fe-S-cluster containining protein